MNTAKYIQEGEKYGTQKIDFYKGRHIVCLKKSDP